MWSAHMAHVCTLSLDIFTLDVVYAVRFGMHASAQCGAVGSADPDGESRGEGSLWRSGVPSVMRVQCVEEWTVVRRWT